MELINEVPPIKVEGRIVACEGGNPNFKLLGSAMALSFFSFAVLIVHFLYVAHNPALGHPIEFICLDLEAPAVCKYCGLRYVQDHHH